MPTKTEARTPAKPAWRKPALELVERFNAALPVHPAAQPKKMFGYPACFVNGHFFVGMHNDDFIVRLPADLKGRLPELVEAAVFDPLGTGQGMKDWWIIPPALTGDVGRLAGFFAAAFAEVRRLPPKAPKPRAAVKKAERRAR